MTDVADWWRATLIDMEPGQTDFPPHPIQDLIRTVTFPQMIWLMLRGKRPSPPQAALREAALVAGVDHDPQPLSSGTARMAVTCGLLLNKAMAAAVKLLGNVLGSAGEQAVHLFARIRYLNRAGASMDAAIARGPDQFRADHRPFIPRFGHSFHKPVDSCAAALLAQVEQARIAGIVGGEFACIAVGADTAQRQAKGKPLPMNINGATAVIYAELGCVAPLARGLFCLSMAVGILSHAWEQMEQGGAQHRPNATKLPLGL